MEREPLSLLGNNLSHKAWIQDFVSFTDEGPQKLNDLDIIQVIEQTIRAHHNYIVVLDIMGL